MKDLIEQILNTPTTKYFSLFIIGYFLFNIIPFIFFLFRVLYSLIPTYYRIVKLFKEYQKQKKDSRFISTIEEIEKIKSIMSKCIATKDAWREYEETIDKTQKNNIYVSSDAIRFFSDDIPAHLLKLRIWWAGPGLLTGLGILGTFAGLTLALKNAPDLSNSKNLVLFASQFLQGTSIAFITSLLGIFFSIVLTIILNLGENFVRRYYRSIRNIIDRLFVKHTSEAYLADIYEKINYVNYRIRELNKKTDQQIETSEKFNNSLLEKIGNLDDRLSGLAEKADKQLEALNTFSTDLALAVAEGIKQGIEQQVLPAILKSLQTLKDAIGELKAEKADQNEEALNSIAGKLENTFKEVVDKLSVQGQEVNSRQEKNMTRMESFLQEMMVKFKDVSTKVEKLAPLVENIDYVTTGINELADKIQNLSPALTQATEEVGKSAGQVQGVSAEVGEVLNKLNGTLSGLIQQQSNIEKITEQERAAIAGLGNEVKRVNDVITQLDGIVSSAGEAATLFENAIQLQRKIGTEFSENLELAAEHSKDIFPIVEKIFNTSRNLQTTMEMSEKILKEIAESSKNQSEWSQNMKEMGSTALERFNSATSEWNATSQNFEGLSAKIREAFSSFQSEVTDALSKSIDHFDKAFSRQVAAVQGIGETLQGIFEALQEELQKFNNRGR